MTIFFNNIKRILRRRMNMVFLLIIPVVMISLMGAFGASGGGSFNLGVIDNDNTPLTLGLIKQLEGKANVKYVKEEDIQNKIFGQTMDLAIIIDKGFTQGVIKNTDVKVNIKSLQETNVVLPLKLSIDSYLNSAMNIASAANGDESKFYDGLKVYDNGLVSTVSTVVKNEKAQVITKTSQMGFLVMCMLFLASLASMIMIEDKEKRVYYRVLSGPVKVSKYMMQNLLSFYGVMVIQVGAIFFFMSVILGVSFGVNLWAMIAVSLVFSLMCVALGVAINTISKDLRQSGLMISLLLSPMCMLGGCWWPADFMPPLLLRIAQFVPTTWIMNAYAELIKGGSPVNTIDDILILLGFTAVFFLFASWKRVDVAK